MLLMDKRIAQDQLREDIPVFRPGDTVRVNVRVREGEKERLQAFEGVVIRRKGGGLDETFTVRKVSNGVGVELPVTTELKAVLRAAIEAGYGNDDFMALFPFLQSAPDREVVR